MNPSAGAGAALLAEFAIEAARCRSEERLCALLRERLRWLFDLEAAALVLGDDAPEGAASTARAHEVTAPQRALAPVDPSLRALAERAAATCTPAYGEGPELAWPLLDGERALGGLALRVASAVAPARTALAVVAALTGAQLATLRAHRAEARAREALAEANERLRTAVVELTRAHAREAENVQRKGELLAAVSHELRTPLHGLLGAVELLAGAERGPASAPLVTLRRAGEALTHLLDDVLELARSEASAAPLRSEVFSVAALLDEVGALFALDAERRGLELVVSADPALADARVGDAGRLRQVLVNLTSNALKFTEHGAVELRASEAHDAEGSANAVRFSVRDTGIGIDAASRARLFEPFAQAHEAQRARYGGTGLGLSICRSLVERMGGSVALRSARGIGSVFTATVPLPLAEAARPLLCDAGGEPSEGPLVVLGVDPTLERTARALDEQLTGLGARIERFESADALRASFPHGRSVALAIVDERWLAALPPEVRSVALATPSRPRDAAGPAVLHRPVSLGDLRALLRPPPADPGARERPATAAPLRVLVVDDDASTRAVNALQLERLGHRVRAFDDGGAALEALRTGDPPDVLLLDLHLRGALDGRAVAEAARAHFAARGAAPPLLLALTGDAAALEGEAPSPFDRVLAKPCARATLEAALRAPARATAAPSSDPP